MFTYGRGIFSKHNINLYFFSRKLKGPQSQRFTNPNQVLKEKIREEKERQKHSQSLKNMYFNNYTVDEMENANEMVKRVFKVENSTPGEVLKYKIERAVQKFQKSPTDCGGAAVQCAVMSQKVIVLMSHVKRFPKDYKTARALTYLLYKRRKMLDYLMRTDYQYFKWVCAQYGIPQKNSQNANHQQNFFCKYNALQGI